MKEHRLKIYDEHLLDLISGQKKCEVRFNDRDYKVGDIITFQRPWSQRNMRGVLYRFKITHIHQGLGLLDGYVMLSVSQLTLKEYNHDG